MGARGPNRTPPAVLRARGSPRAKSRSIEEAATPRPGHPTPAQLRPPNWLLPEAVKYYKELAPELARLGVVGQVDLPGLAVYCQTLAEYAALKRKLKHAGAVAGQIETTVDGRRQRSPEMIQAAKLADTLRTWAREYGLTPGSRASLAGLFSLNKPAALEPIPDSEDDKERFFGAG